MVRLLYISTYGWTVCCEIIWMNIPFPEDAKDFVVNDMEVVNDIYGSVYNHCFAG